MSDLPAVRKHTKPRVGARVRQLEGSTQRVAEPLGLEERDWRAALHRAFASSSPAFVEACLQRLISAVAMPGEMVASTVGLSAALALVQSLEPENEAQAALAVNIACLHAASASLMGRLSTSCTDRGVIMRATAVARLEKAYHDALETYCRIKRGNTQVIRVEKLEVQPGGQAVVGTFTANKV